MAKWNCSLKKIVSYNYWIWGHAIGCNSGHSPRYCLSTSFFFLDLLPSFRDRLKPLSSSSQFSKSVLVFRLCDFPWSTYLFLFTCYPHCLSGFLLIFKAPPHVRLFFSSALLLFSWKLPASNDGAKSSHEVLVTFD